MSSIQRLGASRTFLLALPLAKKFVPLSPSVGAVRVWLACERESDWPMQPWLSEARMVSEHPAAWAHTGRLGICGHTGRDLRLGCGISSHFCTMGLPHDLENVLLLVSATRPAQQ